VGAAIGVFAYALARAPGAADQDHLIGVLAALAGEQQDYFRRTFAGLGLDPAPLAPEALPAAARGLCEGVPALAAAAGFAEILAAMLAAEWLYLTWCEAAAAEGPPPGAPGDWIRLHVAPAFREQVAWLRRRLEELAPALAPDQRRRCALSFGRVLALEIAFHDAPYGSG
jgi:thiaminase/transcriptional activator TenA